MVVIIEDDVAAREALAHYLGLNGIAAESAGTAQEGIELGRMTKPSVIVCDWWLGDSGTGVDVARVLQSELNCGIIFITAQSLQELAGESGDLDVYGYLQKPVSAPELLAAVKGALSAQTAP